ncbi:MAG: PQQ-like beta-propeller repeat protein [Planctomycetota bacterium]|nr:PQQ-like beta-propeller repeat protein [Planctomycetota bacterium]MDA1165560.1 PQQ-like beta-propeller repeat protein [Planctomycetota bacterium]
MRSLDLVAVAIFLSILVSADSASAGDWPQILGPTRDGIAQKESIADSWPSGKPKTVWEKAVGDGFAGVSIAKGIAVVFHRVDDLETAEGVGAKSGKPIWSVAFPTEYVPAFNPDAGPRAAPVIHEGLVYLYGARGNLCCVQLADGKKVWQRDTFADFCSQRTSRGEPAEGYFGFASSPIIEGDRLLLNVGGSDKDAGIVAFDRKTGETLWTATDERASYSSPVAATIDGQRHIVFATRLKVVSVDPANGRVLFEFPFGKLGPAVTAANPLILGNSVFITGSYQFGAVLARAGRSGSLEVWSSDEILSSQYTTSIAHDKTLFGIHGRQDSAPAELRCINPLTRQIIWSEGGFGYATLILADNKLLIMKTDGELVLAAADTQKYRELARATLFDGRVTTRALPALSNGLLYVRDGKTLKCFDLR